MRNKIYFISALLILATVLSACGPAIAQGAGLNSSSSAVDQQAQSVQPTPRTLSVTGHAQVQINPDFAYISIGVHTENADASEAVASNTTQAQKVVDALKAIGIADKDIQTINFSIYPSQQMSPTGEQKPTVYMVDNTVYVTLRDISKIGKILGTATGAGANSIGGIQFDSSDKSAAMTQARKDAVANAQKNAIELAQAAGVTLGQIQNININMPYPVPVFEGKGGSAMAASSNVPISPGQITISADVNIVYEIQ